MRFGFGGIMCFLTLMLMNSGCGQPQPSQPQSSAPDWKQQLEKAIPLYGHRNWIAVVDSAYPAQSRDGIETVVSNAGQVEVLKQVLASLAASKHVKPIVYTDAELAAVDEKDAPGVSAYRQQLADVLKGQKPNVLLHEQIIGKLDQAAQTFRILIIKTNMTIPYTSVFLNLDCAYWGPEGEAKVRAALAAQAAKH